MLKKLFIRNFALIDRLEIDFHHGFNVLTGETGAGKSIIIDAVGVVIGGQGLTEFIRSGEEKALVQAVFEVEGNRKVLEILQTYGLLPDQGEDLILSRELVKSGKNICRVNGRPVNLSVFKDIAQSLVDIYGQHYQQSLLMPQKHIELLDEYGGKRLLESKEKLAAVYEELTALQAKVSSMEAQERERVRMADIYKFQLGEIDKSRLSPGEDIALEEERNILSNAEKLAFLSNTAYELLYEGGKQRPVIELLHEAITSVKAAGSMDDSVRPIYEMLESSLYQIEEAARDLKAYAAKIEADPARLEEIENRLDLIRNLKRKYGNTIQEILDYRDQVASSLALLENYDQELTDAKNAWETAKKEYLRIAGELSEARKQAASGLKKQITEELKELNMPHVTFDIDISSKSVPSEQGLDEVEFLISPNKGEPLKPLAKIVSGGEVSRIMLAFKSILARADSIFTLIFDEVDSGIGGHTLHAVAQKLSAIGRDRQVICVTHSPQIAGYGDSHYRITKTVSNNRTVTQVEHLSAEERVNEIARMLSGGKVTPLTRKHAEEILKQQVLF